MDDDYFALVVCIYFQSTTGSGGPTGNKYTGYGKQIVHRVQDVGMEIL